MKAEQYTIIVTAEDGSVSANGLFRKRERADDAAELMRDPFSSIWVDVDPTQIEVVLIETIK